MKYNRYTVYIIIRTLALLLSCLIFGLLYYKTNRFFSIVFLGGLIVLQTIWLISFLNLINRDLANFLLYVYDHDISLAFNQEKINKNFRGIYQSFKKINTDIQKMRLEKESKIHLLYNVVDHMEVAFIAYDNIGKIVLINNAAKRLFQKNLKTLEDIRLESPAFYEFLTSLTFNYKGVYNLGDHKNDSIPLLVRCSGFLLLKDQVRLVSFQSIKTQLEDNEMESWQKLIRVLAHEISNSITPITILSNNIHQHLSKKGISIKQEIKYPEEIIKDVLRSSELIEQRSHRLIEFIDGYKSYTKLPEPIRKHILVKELFDQIGKYFDKQFKIEQIKFETQSLPDSQVFMDGNLIEQVLINLIQNSMHALKSTKNKFIKLRHYVNDADCIEIVDNGCGIPEDVKNHVFVPFFTTKKNGSGIGLSLSKNIMHMHKGSIKINTADNQTVVTLYFPENK